MEKSTYAGDALYNIECTGDCVVGDRVKFEQAVFSGTFRNATFEGFEVVEGEIIKESYGEAKQQHTFTLLLPDGTKKRIKGRNLYKNGTWRQAWDNEDARILAQDEKHARGDAARVAREERSYLAYII